LSNVYSQLESDNNKELVIQQFESVSKSALKVGASKNKQDKILLDTYKIWLELEQFHSEFCELILNLVQNTFSDVAKGDCILPLSERRFFEKKTDLKKIYELTKDSKDAKACLLRYFFQTNIDVNVSDKIITQIVSKETDTKHQTFAKFKLRFDDLYSGTLDKKNRESFWTTLERLSSRVVECEQYKFSPKVFKENPHSAYNRLKLLPSLFRFWYCQKFDIEKSDKSDNDIYNSFLEVVCTEIKHVPEDKIISVSLDTLLSFLKTGIETPIQLTTLNKNFFNSQNKESAYLSSYLKYLLQLWSEDNSRNSGMALPRLNNSYYSKKDRQQASDFYSQIREVNPQLTLFLENRLSDCIVRLSNHVFNDISYDQSLDSIIDWSCSNLDIPLTEYKETLEKIIDEFIFKYENSHSLTISDLLTLTGNNLSIDHYDYFKSNCLIHLLVVQSTSDQLSFSELIQQSCEQEIACLNRSVFLNYSLPEVFGQEFKETILAKYQKFKKDAFLMAKAWLLLLNNYTEFNGNIEGFVNDNLSKFFNNKLPKSKDMFCNKKLNGEIKALCKTFEVDANKLYSFPFEDVFYLSEDELVALSYFKTDNYHCFGISELLDQLTNDNLLSQWRKVMGKHDETVIYHALMSKFIDSKSIRFTDVILNGNRNKLKDVVQGKYFDEFVKSISNQSFNQVFLEFDESFSNCLEQKLDVVSNITFLGDSRFKLITDENHFPIKLGQGGFGCVYKVNDTLLDSIVAIKLIPKWSDSIHLEKKLLSEAIIMRQCRHESVITIYDVHSFYTEKLVFNSNIDKADVNSLRDDVNVFGLVMEYPETSKTLVDLNIDSLSFEAKCKILIQLTNAVEKIHSLKIVHGDIKPSNILIDDLDNIKLLDFGSATHKNYSLTSNTDSIFLSDNVRAEKDAELIDDLYSIGAIAVYLFAPTLIDYLMKNANQIDYSLYIALQVVTNNWSIMEGGEKVTIVEELCYFDALANTKRDKCEIHEFLSGLQQFESINNGEDYGLLDILIQLVTPYTNTQLNLLDKLMRCVGWTYSDCSSPLVYRKLESATDVKLIFERLVSNMPSVTFINGVMIYGKLLDKNSLENIPMKDISNYQRTTSATALFDNDLDDDKDLTSEFYDLLCLFKVCKGSLFKIKCEDLMTAHIVYKDYERENDKEQDRDLISDEEKHNRIKKHGQNIGSAALSNYFLQTKISFSKIEDEIEISECFYKLNIQLLERLGWLKNTASENSLYLEFEPKWGSYNKVLNVYELAFFNNYKYELEIDNLNGCKLRTLYKIDEQKCSVYANIFFSYKKQAEVLIDEFMSQSSQTQYFLKVRENEKIFNQLLDKFEESHSQDDFINAYKNVSEEFVVYIWQLFSEGTGTLENYLMSINNCSSPPCKYDFFKLELIINPKGKYFKKLKKIHSTFSERLEITPLFEDLKMIAAWRSRTNYYNVYKLLKELNSFDIA
jgi:serine/threonine protein kinase